MNLERGEYSALFCLRLIWDGLAEHGVKADEDPYELKDNKANFEGKERDVAEDSTAEGVEQVVGGGTGIHEAKLVAGVSDEDQERSG